MLTKEMFANIWWMLTSPQLFAGCVGTPKKSDVWMVFTMLVMQESDELLDLATLHGNGTGTGTGTGNSTGTISKTEEMIVSSIIEFEEDQGKHPILQQLFCVITSKSLDE